MQIFSREEQEKLQEYLLKDMDFYKVGILICLFTGLRLGEICALSCENILLDKKILRVTQTVQRVKSQEKSWKAEPRFFYERKSVLYFPKVTLQYPGR